MADWDSIRILVGAFVAVGIGTGGFVATIIWWLSSLVRENDRALTALKEACAQMDAATRHALRSEMQREATINEQNDDARRREIAEVTTRIVRLETLLGNKRS